MTTGTEPTPGPAVQAVERRPDFERAAGRQRRARDEVQYLTMIRRRARGDALAEELREE